MAMRKRHSTQQVVRKLTQADRMLAEGKQIADVCRELQCAGHRIRLVLTSDDQDPTTPAIMGFRHASVGTSSHNTISSASRLLLPICTD